MTNNLVLCGGPTSTTIIIYRKSTSVVYPVTFVLFDVTLALDLAPSTLP